ncbi:MAG: LacI family DNA-binding transcriptional regulator, partial [Planctomycetes bacterium]|nr:LacI family DNA-binding transcriptional regulator [Planctomycetota bacterium]
MLGRRDQWAPQKRRTSDPPSTVSRALDPKRSSEVSSAMSARVRELAEQRGYEPDPWARSLRTR